MKQALKACGPKVNGEHPSIDALTAELSAECIQHLVKNNLVDSVGSDAEVTGGAVDDDLTTIPSNTLRSTLGQSEYSTGEGIGVAVIDSGIAPLPAFSGRIVGFYDFTTDSVIAAPAHDEWTRRQREAGQYVCFGVVPDGMATAVGLFQVRSMEPGFASAEWGFVIGSPYWGTGLFMAGAELVLEFAFKTIGAFRLEARSAVQNGRGNGALRKLGAVREGVLRKAFLLRGTHHDQNIWSILASAWIEGKVTWEPRAA